MQQKRISALIKKIEDNNTIDALLVTKPENIFYLTSFTADTVLLVIGLKKRFIVTDFIYAEAVNGYFKDIEVFVANSKESLWETMSTALNKYGIKRLGFESCSFSLFHYKKLKRILKGPRLIATEHIIEYLREIKENKEILILKDAIRTTAKTLKRIKQLIRPKITELTVSKYIKEIFIKEGAGGYSFEPIVATQPFSSQPHYKPREKCLGTNKVILIDMGARLRGYNSDLTRMLSLGKISTKFKGLYNILLDAQRYAIELIRPGIKIHNVDMAARQHIDKKGLGKFFGHALGHGIGLEIHERPNISSSNKERLKEGMVFTVEPGIYIPGYGGLRIEDIALVTNKGCQLLTNDINKSV
jgi:Xaa-Pro aminopeptidase